MENFVILEEIAQTQFSTIYKCKNKKSKEVVAIKVIHQKKPEESPSKETLREMLVLMNFKHPNIVVLNSFFVHKTSIALEMEYCITSLDNVVSSISKPFHAAQIKKIVKCIAEGLNYLHSNDIIHRDLKPGNIFVDFNSVIKIGDFGSCKILSKAEKLNNTPSIGTKWYKAPEIIMGSKEYDKSIDIWSFGCLIADLFLLEPLFPGTTDFEMINYIFNFLGYSEDDKAILNPKLDIIFRDMDSMIFEKTFDIADSEALDLLKKMIVLNPKNRLSINHVLLHPFLADRENYIDVSLPL